MGGASDCIPIRLVIIAAARIEPITLTGQPIPRSRRPRKPDRETNTGAGADSGTSDPGPGEATGCAAPDWTEDMTGRTHAAFLCGTCVLNRKAPPAASLAWLTR